MSRTHYVNNKELFDAMVEHKNKLQKNIENNVEQPQVSNYIGECIMKIATHLAHRPNFSNYSFKDEMICDGIENCLRYMNNFDPKKSENPFSYFTQIIFFAFLRRIQKEKKQLYLKYESTKRSAIFDDTEIQSRANNQYEEWSNEHLMTFIDDFEKSKKLKKEKNKRKKDEIMEDLS